MGIQAIAVLPACLACVALAVFMISGRRNIRRTIEASTFSVMLIVCTTAVLFVTVLIFEFLGLSFAGELFYVVTVVFVIFRGLRYGRLKFDFTNREIVLQGIIALCGCAAASLCFLGWTVKI